MHLQLIFDNLLRHNSVDRDDIHSKLIQSTSLHRVYLLVKIQDDQSCSTCSTSNLQL